ncbi:DNA-binding transcriptional MerR regulator [Breznakia sp. PF5-3]|uniref:MerR family transcriptional regulator n=1 Tax=unclassified Breznakia TaxID=2623764 RepID=UPI0024053AC0|nr:MULTISPECIES: MerR family transcriptional regulator [unclassified Breznakia]MDL2276871.1 MerR family transcriptional regulator [Breznakia sp. OttesenSCG-928-G09]MDF9824783.1 DNA-binding transcriptional MerR regulator [Breznakia sp. PM6-1]MDF9835761.1 DNA-binding transcriptional MerR regulator [Breznakia sp. PF5-3]MDF9837847.1 DNA-binding transcriptional MerR regulator [Breznakia sp. PFB2-8]MDF9859782.1 DNA-binding transcriptional MerR regulator [Breznakia sp. PH5-24]
MDKTYSTSEIAKLIGVHSNTVRLYEEWGFITKPKRKKNGYRIFTDLHLQQMRILRSLFQVPIVQNGMRKKVVTIIKVMALQEYDEALKLTLEYLNQIDEERQNAEEAIEIVEKMLHGKKENSEACLTRKETADVLGISIDRLRNWELNGLILVKRKKNGYRVYYEEDINRLKIIRLLRYANYSLTAIMRMLNKVSEDPTSDVRSLINTPHPDEYIITVCDELISSLHTAKGNAKQAYKILKKLNPPS